jgi:DNA (cytosine-5)-methyltransferase 1
MSQFTFYEFFAGGGMARLGLGENWNCLFANDIDTKKAASYKARFGNKDMVVGDVSLINVNQLPGQVDLVWASFPCQDLSLAGNGLGLSGSRSGTFWPFWRLISELRGKMMAPRAIVLENVYGAITSHGGKDLDAIVNVLSEGGYKYGPVVIDAVQFLPQSRPRLFIVAFDSGLDIPENAALPAPSAEWHPEALEIAFDRANESTRANWIWWYLPTPPKRKLRLEDVIEINPAGVRWHTPFETQKLVAMMSPINLKKLEAAKYYRKRVVGTLYKRTRLDENGFKTQRAEIRFDDIAGCLRTPAGGSSRQTIVVVEGDDVRSRLLSPREAARLMGIPDDYKLPVNYNDAYKLAGDGVVAPVVNYIAKQLLEPILNSQVNERRAA